MEILGAREEITGWKRWIYFTYEGKKYDASLWWDLDGYELFFNSEDGVEYKGVYDMPKWAEEWDEAEHDGENLFEYLDNLTYQRVKTGA